MTTALHLAGPDDLDKVTGLMQRSHEERGLPFDNTHRKAVTSPLLDGSPLGAIWTVGPQKAPLGYIMISFGWSVPLGGMIGWVEDIFIRPSVRNRGIGTEVLHAVARNLAQADLKAVHAQIPAGQEAIARFCQKAGLRSEESLLVLTEVL